MSNALNIGGTVGIFFEDWVEISEGETLEYEVSLHEEANLDKVYVACSSFVVKVFELGAKKGYRTGALLFSVFARQTECH